MKQFILSVTLLWTVHSSFAQSNSAISPYVSFLNSQTTSAKDYILDLFNTHDIVVICERNHNELTQYDLYLDIIRDNRFIEKVGNVFTEVGTSSLNPGLNSFLHTKNLPAEQQQQQILSFHRNLTWFTFWEKYNYPYFLQNLYTLNNSLPPKRAINLYPCDLPIRWDKTFGLLKTHIITRTCLQALHSITRSKNINWLTEYPVL